MWLMSRVGPAVLVAGVWLALTGVLLAEALKSRRSAAASLIWRAFLPPAVAEELSAKLQAHEAKTTNQVAVLIVPSLEGEPLFDISHRVATTWNLGRKGTDNGALLLIAIKDRKVRVEVGYGLEGVLTDARSRRLSATRSCQGFERVISPRGITAGVQAILKTIEGTYSAQERSATSSPSSETFNNAAFAVILGVVIGLLLSRVHRVLGPVAAGGLSFFAAPWAIPALIAGAVSVALVSLLSAVGEGSGSGRKRGGNPFDGTWFSTQNGGWGSGGSEDPSEDPVASPAVEAILGEGGQVETGNRSTLTQGRTGADRGSGAGGGTTHKCGDRAHARRTVGSLPRGAASGGPRARAPRSYDATDD